MKAWRVFEDGAIYGAVLPNMDREESPETWMTRLGFIESTRKVQCCSSCGIGFVIFERRDHLEYSPAVAAT